MPVKTEDVTRRMPRLSREAIMRGLDTSQHTLDRMEAERPNQMSFGEQVVEALGEYVDAKDDYARARRSVGGEFANPDHVDKAATRLQSLLDKVKFAL